MKNKKLQAVTTFLMEQGIEFKVTNYGNPYYFQDGFCVPGIIVNFDFDHVFGNEFNCLLEKQNLFSRFIKKQKDLVIGFSGKCGIYEPYYCIFSRPDYEALMEHQNRIRTESEKFWIERKKALNK